MKKIYLLFYPYLISILGVSLIIIFFLFYYKFTASTDPISIIEEGIAQENDDFSSGFLNVQILGAINQPGDYQLSSGDIVQDVIDQAGGLTFEADLTNSDINPGSLVYNDQKIFIPKISPSPSDNIAITDETNSKQSVSIISEDFTKININIASADELELLSGVGEKTAQKIIDYRQNNQFDTIEEIMEVNGIGPKLFEKIKDQIIV